MLAPQAVICAQRPALQQREGAVAPGAGRRWPPCYRQRADRAGSRPTAPDKAAWPSVISVVPGFTLARTNASIDLAELSAITARRNRPERVSRYFAPLRLGFGLPAPRSITSTAPTTRILPAKPGLEERVAGAEGNLRLIHLDDAFEKIAVGIDHRAPKLLRQQPGRLVGDAELVLQLSRRHAVGCCHLDAPPENHVVSGNFDRCIAVPAVSEVCRPQSRHSNRRGRLFKATARPPPQAGQTNPSRQRRDRNASQRASSGNSRWNSASVRPRPTAPRSEPALASSAPSFRHYI